MNTPSLWREDFYLRVRPFSGSLPFSEAIHARRSAFGISIEDAFAILVNWGKGWGGKRFWVEWHFIAGHSRLDTIS